MLESIWNFRRLLCAAVCSALPVCGLAQINVPTERYDDARTGANLSENQLKTTNVDTNHFGKLWSYTVSGSVFAQPLYLKDVPAAEHGLRNLLFVATMNDVVYAFDADSNSTLWQKDLTTEVPGSTPVPIVDITGYNTLNIVGNIGIESTPVIDIEAGTIYLLARTKENGKYVQRLHALNFLTGAEQPGSPVVIAASVPGTGMASVNGVVSFDPLMQNQRAALALASGQVFLAWASHQDITPYHGWIISYDEKTLTQTGVFLTTPNGEEGGVWMAGRGPAIDKEGNVYYISGNGDWDGKINFSEAFLKFGSRGKLPLLDWFTPDDYVQLNEWDEDLGSSGPLLIPGTDLVIGGGKQGYFYLTHTDQMGHEQTGNGQIVQTIDNAGGDIESGPVYWNRKGSKDPWLYVWADDDVVKAYRFNGRTFDAAPASEGTLVAPQGHSGGVLTLSAHHNQPHSGILWASMPFNANGINGVQPGILRALNADDLSQELWNSQQNATRDSMGNWPKFSPPLVVNGRVYMASSAADGESSTQVSVYGLLPLCFSLSAKEMSKLVLAGRAANFIVDIDPLSGFNGKVNLNFAGLPKGTKASFSTASLPRISILKIETKNTTPSGRYPITVTAISGSTRLSLQLELVVESFRPEQRRTAIGRLPDAGQD